MYNGWRDVRTERFKGFRAIGKAYHPIPFLPNFHKFFIHLWHYSHNCNSSLTSKPVRRSSHNIWRGWREGSFKPLWWDTRILPPLPLIRNNHYDWQHTSPDLHRDSDEHLFRDFWLLRCTRYLTLPYLFMELCILLRQYFSYIGRLILNKSSTS